MEETDNKQVNKLKIYHVKQGENARMEKGRPGSAIFQLVQMMSFMMCVW